jgi:cytochrome c oxidase assembly protein subunit 15
VQVLVLILQAISTFAVLIHLPIIARFAKFQVLPKATRKLATLTAAAAVGQVTLGITTLLYLVPVPLAATHQAGSVVLLTCLLALGASLRRPGQAVEMVKKSLKAAGEKSVKAL